MNDLFGKIGSPRTAALWLAALGFLARLALAISMGIDAPPDPGSDSEDYDTYAWNLLQGNGYRGMSPDVADRNHLTAYRLPGPSMLFACIYKVAGRRYDVIRVANCLIGALAVPLIYEIGRLCFGHAVGLVAAGIYAIYPTALIFSVGLLSEPVGNLSFLAFILACLLFAERPSWQCATITGVLFGVAIYMRANAILMLPFLAIWIAWQFRSNPRAILQASAIPLLALSMLVPWTVRNYRVFHTFIPLSTMGGSVLLQGNNDLVANEPHLYGYNVWDTDIPEYREALQTANDEVERDRRAKAFAVEWIKSHPEKWGYLVRMKIWRGLTPFLQPNSPRVFRLAMLLTWGPVLVLFGLAYFPTLVGFLRANSPGWLIHLAILHFILMSVIFFGYSRYRQPVEPLCIILAVRAVEFLVQKAAHRQGSGAAAKAATVA